MKKYRVTNIIVNTAIQEFEAENEDDLWRKTENFDWTFADEEFTDEDWEIEELDDDL